METLKNAIAKRTITAAFIFSFNLAFTAYVNSTLLSGFFSEQKVGLIFSLASIATLIVLEYSPKILERFGVRKCATLFLLISILSLTGILSFDSGYLVALSVVVYILANNITVYNLDIIIEHFAKHENIGQIRGLYLTITNLAWLASPFVAGYLVENYGVLSVYTAVLIAVIPTLMILYFGLRKFEDRQYKDRSLSESFSFVHSHKDILKVIFINFLLQFFFAWMVIYTPLYLHSEKGISFSQIGIIFTIMLIPFSLLQYPLGKAADKKLGERELLVAGFIIMACSVFVLATYQGSALGVFAAILFFSRVGAATTEVMSETYFFKFIDDREPFLISIFRVMSPMGYLVGPLIATLIFKLSGFYTLYITLGIIMVLGAIVALKLHDTK